MATLRGSRFFSCFSGCMGSLLRGVPASIDVVTSNRHSSRRNFLKVEIVLKYSMSNEYVPQQITPYTHYNIFFLIFLVSE